MRIGRKPLGDAGLNEYSDNSNRTIEHLAELQGRAGSIRYQTMSKGDDIVGMILRVHKNPIRSASWNIPYPSNVTDKEKLAIEVIKDKLFGESGSEFDAFLGQILSMLEYGFSVFEQYYQPERIGSTMYLVPQIEQRMQTSIEEILPKKKIIRQLTIDKGTIEIPFETLLFFSLNKQGEDWRGESLLRNAYASYKRKKIYQKWMGIGVQRSVSGIPSMEVPLSVKYGSEEYTAVETMLKNICHHEEAYMITPEGYKFMYHESKFDADPVQKAIDGCNSGMALSVLAQFVMLGQNGNTGAFALSRDQSDFFLDGLQYIINLICGVINSRVINPFIKINFGESVDPARVRIKGMNLNKKAGQELANVLSVLSQSGFVKPTTDDEVQLRNNLEMPELTEEELERRENQPEPSAPVENKIQFAEKITRDERQKYIEDTNKEVLDFMQANLALIKDKMIADIESTLKKGTIDIQGLKNVTVSSSKYLKGLQRKLSGIAVESFECAKKQAKKNSIKLADIDPKDIEDKTLKQYVLNESTSIVDKQTSGMLNRAILTASNNSLKNLSIAQTMSNVSKAVDKYITSAGVVVDGSLVVVGTSNFGEYQFNKQIEDQLWGYRFVNPSPEAEICKWYKGKTFSINSPELAEATPPLHPNCNSYMEPIYKTEKKPEEIDDVIPPPTIRQGKTIF
jgi:phage gp29-like protein